MRYARGWLSRKLTTILLAEILLQASLQIYCVDKILAEQVISNTITESGQEFSRQYATLTKSILLTGIDLERFSLNYRLEGPKQPKFRVLRYFLSQEAGASGGLAFEITEIDQLAKGKHNPLRISQSSLHNAFTTVLATEIIAGSGSALEFSLNAMQAVKNRRHGFDSRAANLYVATKLKKIDDLIAQRDALVSDHTDSPDYLRASLEGKILHQMRNVFIEEYSDFHANTRSYLAFQNSFFLLNTAYNTIFATAAGIGYKAVTEPKLNGPTNILFTVSGAMAAASPFICTAFGSIERRHADHVLEKQLGESHFDPAALASECAELKKLLASNSEGRLISTLPATQRLAIYTESDQQFRMQLESETNTARHFEKVALEASELGPLIGGTLTTQGILGTVGYYKYALRPRKQISLLYDGAIAGCVGSSMGVVGNAAWLLASWSYEQHLKKEHRLPVQLIKERLNHLDDLEKLVSAI